jgi:hypothetical protein
LDDKISGFLMKKIEILFRTIFDNCANFRALYSEFAGIFPTILGYF